MVTPKKPRKIQYTKDSDTGENEGKKYKDTGEEAMIIPDI